MDIDAGNSQPEAASTAAASTPAPPADTKYAPSKSADSATPGTVPPDVAAEQAAKAARAARLKARASAGPVPEFTTAPPTTGVVAPGTLKRTVSQALGPRPPGLAGRPTPLEALLPGSSAKASVSRRGSFQEPLGPLSTLASKTAEEKAQQWLASMRARTAGAAAPSAAAAVAMDAVPTRSARAGAMRSAGRSHSEDDEPSDAESTGSHGEPDSRGSAATLAGSGDTVRLLTLLCDIAAFNAECLSKLSGVALPDFDAASDQ